MCLRCFASASRAVPQTDPLFEATDGSTNRRAQAKSACLENGHHIVDEVADDLNYSLWWCRLARSSRRSTRRHLSARREQGSATRPRA